MYLLRSSKNHMSTPKLKSTHSRITIGLVTIITTLILVLPSYGSTNWTLRSTVFDPHYPTPYTIGPLQWVHIKLSPTVGIIAISYYQPHNTKKPLVNQQFARFQQYLQQLLDKYGPDTHLLINGDFNMTNTRWYSPSTNYPGQRWFDLCTNLTPLLVCTNQNQYTYYDNKPTKAPSILALLELGHQQIPAYSTSTTR